MEDFRGQTSVDAWCLWYPTAPTTQLWTPLISTISTWSECASHYKWLLFSGSAAPRQKNRTDFCQSVSKTEDLQFNLTQCAKGKHMEMKWKRSVSLMRRQAPGDHNWRETYFKATHGKAFCLTLCVLPAEWWCEFLWNSCEILKNICFSSLTCVFAPLSCQPTHHVSKKMKTFVDFLLRLCWNELFGFCSTVYITRPDNYFFSNVGEASLHES